MTRALLIWLIDQRKTLKGIANHTCKSKTTVRYWLRKYGLKTKPWGIIGGLTVDTLQALVKSSVTYTECLRKLNLPASGQSFTLLKQRIIGENIQTNHFKPFGFVKGSPNIGLTLDQFKQLLTANSTVSQKRLRKYVKQFGLLPYCCATCNQDPVWNGKTLILQLDHKNGIHRDCRIENLRWLCPNCHSQTITFGRRNGVVSVTV